MSDARALELLKRFGANTTSFQLLEPGIEYWFSEEIDGFVGYADSGSAWVVLGEPVADAERVDELRTEFLARAAKEGKRVRFFALESGDVPDLTVMAIGEQPEWEPGAWQAALTDKRSLREQLRRARAKGVMVRERKAKSVADSLEKLAREWKRSRQMAPMRFAVTMDLFHHASERRYFVAEREGEIVAALVAAPIYARDGWLIEDMLRSPVAPNGTTELLFDAAITALGGSFVSMGLAPLSRTDNRVLGGIRALTPWLFDWSGLHAFKSKLGPSQWRPVYAAWPKRERGLGAFIDILRSFAGGSLVKFGAATALHRYRAVLLLMALLLLPWVAALCSPQAADFFPSEEVRAGWVLYDVFLFGGLVAAAYRFHRALVQLLVIAVGLDVAVGVWQLVSWNAAMASPWDWPFLGVAIAAPMSAFIYLVALLRVRGPISR